MTDKEEKDTLKKQVEEMARNLKLFEERQKLIDIKIKKQQEKFDELVKKTKAQGEQLNQLLKSLEK